MKTFSIISIFLIFLFNSCQNKDCDEKEIADLIDQLASPFKPKFPNGHLDVVSSDGRSFSFKQEHFQVKNATEKLVSLGPVILPYLIKHLNDERYSYSRVTSAWYNFPVSTRIKKILYYVAGVEVRTYVGLRKNKDNNNRSPKFSEYLNEMQDLERWAKISSKKNSKILKIEYLNWCIGKEKSYGFIDNKQEQNVLSKYYEEIKKLNTL